MHPPSSPTAAASGADASEATRIVVVVAHPQMELSRLNRALMMAAARQPADGEAGAAPRARIDVRDLYALYPDYLIDIEAERRALEWAQLIVWVHPIRWYGPPALMKLWFDDVLGFGWAYGPKGDAIRGRSLWLVISTGGPAASYDYGGYNRYPFEAFLPPYKVTADLCGLRFLPPRIVHGAHRLTPEEVAAQAQDFSAMLHAYPWPGLDDAPHPDPHHVPAEARHRERGTDTAVHAPTVSAPARS